MRKLLFLSFLWATFAAAQVPPFLRNAFTTNTGQAAVNAGQITVANGKASIANGAPFTNSPTYIEGSAVYTVRDVVNALDIISYDQGTDAVLTFAGLNGINLTGPVTVVGSGTNQFGQTAFTNLGAGIAHFNSGGLLSSSYNLFGITSSNQIGIGTHQFISANGSNGVQLSTTGSVVSLQTFKPSSGSNSPLAIGASPTPGTYALWLATNGNVGIGTAAPGALLELVTGSAIALKLTGPANNFAEYLLGNSTSGQSYGLDIQAGTTSADIALRIRNVSVASTLLFVRGDGNVGIGTGTPTNALQVTGISMATAGFASYQSNKTFVTLVTLPASPSLWTNTFSFNVVAGWVGAAVTGVSINSSFWPTALTGGSVSLQPGEWVGFTNSIVPIFGWKPQ